MRWVSRLTTFAVVFAVIAAIALLLRSKVPDLTIGQSFRTYAKFRDGSKLTRGSPVVIAGVRIGDIEKISISGRFARVDMVLQDDIEVPAGSFVTRRADSLFGDSYVEIIPTFEDEGEPAARLLKPGEPLIHVIEGSSTDSVLRATADALPKIDNALESMHELMFNGRKAVNGALIENLTASDSWLAAGHIEAPIEATHRAMVTVDDLTSRGANALANSAPDVDRALDRIDGALVESRKRMANVRASMVTGMQEARAGMDGLDEQLQQATDVMAAINDGRGEDFKGTLGRLVNDPELGNTLDDAAAAGREATASLDLFKSWLGMRVELNLFARTPRIYATAEIRAHTDKFYLVEFERGALGGVPSDRISDAAGSTSYIRHQEIRDQLRFTAQFGKQIGPLALRGGIKDGTFGFGVDVLMMSGRLQISTDVFGSFRPTPRLKVAAAFAVFRSIYVLAGVDDALNTPGYLAINNGINQQEPDQLTEVRFGRDYFVGATLHFTDADLSTLLRVYGALLAGALAF
jgi:phospholipid/cholesterol/gamma-HCH transport system substrate-binding protein